MNSEVERSCGCEPCAVDLDTYGFRTEWEDQFFVGKQCLWHKQIRGTRGCISPDVLDGAPAIFVQFRDDQFTVPVLELRRWAKRVGGKRK
jgi:hypothetical protein